MREQREAPAPRARRTRSCRCRGRRRSRLSASEANATRRPLSEIDGSNEDPSAGAPDGGPADQPRRAGIAVSWMNTSIYASWSRSLRFVARDSYATTVPFAEIDGSPESPFAGEPSGARLTSVVVSVTRSRTKTSAPRRRRPSLRFAARESKATYARPPARSRGSWSPPSAPAPAAPVARLTSFVSPVSRSRT